MQDNRGGLADRRPVSAPRRGIGRMLMQHAENHASEQGYAVIGLMVAVHNSVARELYNRLDYRDSNILMRKRLPALSEEAPAADPMPGL